MSDVMTNKTRKATAMGDILSFLRDSTGASAMFRIFMQKRGYTPEDVAAIFDALSKAATPPAPPTTGDAA